MGSYQFKILPIETQIDLLVNEGHYILERITSKFQVVLYSLGNFYVELWFQNDSKDHYKTLVVDQTYILANYDIDSELVNIFERS